MRKICNIYLIKDLSRLSGHSVYTIKFYLKLGLIQEAGRSPETRFRYFDETTLAQLSTIRALRKQKKSLTEIAQVLHGANGFKPQAASAKPAGSLKPEAPAQEKHG